MYSFLHDASRELRSREASNVYAEDGSRRGDVSPWNLVELWLSEPRYTMRMEWPLI